MKWQNNIIKKEKSYKELYAEALVELEKDKKDFEESVELYELKDTPLLIFNKGRFTIHYFIDVKISDIDSWKENKTLIYVFKGSNENVKDKTFEISNHNIDIMLSNIKNSKQNYINLNKELFNHNLKIIKNELL